MPKELDRALEGGGGKGVPFMAPQPCAVREVGTAFACPSYCALCFIHQEHNSFLPL